MEVAMLRLCACLLILSLPATASAQGEIDFAGRTWTVYGQAVITESYLGREAVRLRSGAIVLPDVEFENGTIEFDVATTGHRSFIGLAFRLHEDDSYEDFYLRPHNSGRFDAIQYTPVFNGVSAWQLYPEYNASLEITTERWLHVMLVISGSRMEAYLDGASEPALVVDDLKCGRRQGAVALKSNFPSTGLPADLYPTAFANFELHPDEGPTAYKEAEPPASGFIGRWAISPSLAAEEGTIRELPRETEETEGWTVVESESSGLVNLARYRGFPEGARGATILARVVIDSDRDQVKKLNFGFSDRGSIFLNGQIVFSGDNTYMTRSQRYLGVVTIDNDAVYLPLRRGANELLVAVSEAFGGWGLIARFENLDGISFEPQGP
jgi:hypothetical protein